MSKRATQIITVFNDGSVHVQDLHEATTTTVAENDGSLDDPGSNNPKPPPKDP